MGILIHISGGLDSILIFIQKHLSVLKISKAFVFFLRTSGQYLTRYGQGSVFNIGLYFFEYSVSDILKKKTKVLNILIRTKNVS